MLEEAGRGWVLASSLPIGGEPDPAGEADREDSGWRRPSGTLEKSEQCSGLRQANTAVGPSQQNGTCSTRKGNITGPPVSEAGQCRQALGANVFFT